MDKLNQKKQIVALAGLIIIILTFLFFRLSFDQKNKKKISQFKKIMTISEPLKRELKPMDNCSQIKNERYSHILADYFISSSFNSALIGNQVNDYLSLEFLEEVIQSGARYLEFQINPSTNKQFPEPLVGTGNITGNWSNSKNTIPLNDIFESIKRLAFSDNINTYPLIIYLDFNSKNKYLINKVGETINDYLHDSFITNHKYKKFPFTMEKSCIFNGKIIFLSSLSEAETFDTSFQTINMPSLGFVKRMYYNDVSININTENSLSKKIQVQDDKKFKDKFKNIDDILKETDFYQSLLDLNLTHPLFYFNKVGISIIIPHIKTDKFTLNYEPQPFFDLGCQIVALNFQESLEKGYKNNVNRNKITSQNSIIFRYLAKFKNNSLVLKDDDYRFIKEELIINPAMIYVPVEKEKPTELKLIDDFYNQNKFNVFTIQSYANQNLFLDINYGIVRFIERRNGMNYKPKLFMFFPSRNNSLKFKGAVVIIPLDLPVSINYIKNKHLILDGVNFRYNKVTFPSTNIKKSSFFIGKPICDEESAFNDIQTISIRTSDVFNTPYLGIKDKLLSTYYENSSVEMKMNSCFNIIKQNVKLILTIQHIKSGAYLKVLKSGDFIFSGSKITNKHKFQLIAKDNNYIDNSFNLKTVIDDNYISYNFKNNKMKADLDQSDFDSDNKYLGIFRFKINSNGELIQVFNILKEDFDNFLTNQNSNPIYKDKNNLRREMIFNCKIEYLLN